MYLPSNEQLNIGALSKSFSNMSESYKIFWFNGIMKEIGSNNKVMTYRTVISHMIVSAWYMVSEYHLNLGPSDTLEKLVNRAQAISKLKSSSKEIEIVDFINKTDDKEIKEYINVLTLNVPYRLQAPFLNGVTNALWKSKNGIIEYINLDGDVIYHFDEFDGLDTKIIINDKWFTYLKENSAIILGWIESNLINYLQRRNPTVPGIPNKIYPPEERKLDNVKKLWKGIIDYRKDIGNIYDLGLSIMDGSDVSIDHFVPWTYVAHDELWNLVPTTKSINSSKSNNLPNWNMYFPKLCDVEYILYSTIHSNEKIRVLFDKAKKTNLNDEKITFNLYEVKNLDKDKFSNTLESIIYPAYIAAKELGFKEWIR